VSQPQPAQEDSRHAKRTETNKKKSHTTGDGDNEFHGTPTGPSPASIMSQARKHSIIYAALRTSLNNNSYIRIIRNVMQWM